MADPAMTLLSRNDLDIITDKATGRVALVVKAADGTHTTIERGYTGVRDITGDMSGLTGGSVTVARDGYTVTLTFQAITTAGGSVVLSSSTFPNGSMFHPENGTIAGAAAEGNDATARVGITSSGVMAIWGSSSTQPHSATLTFTTARPWGAALPGVEEGEGVVYL